jgi:hypothetical protein
MEVRMFRILEAAGACLFLTLPAATTAQVTNLMPSDGAVVALELNKPFLESDAFGTATSTLMARVLIPMGERVHFMGDLGLSYATANEVNSTTLSNAELGVVFEDADALPIVRLSVVVPTGKEFGDDDFATGTGFFTHPERVDRFLPDMWSINGEVSPSRRFAGGHMGFRLGGSVMIPDQGDSELFARYGGYFVRESGGGRFGVEMSGQAIISESGLSLGERTIHQVTLLGGVLRDGAVPELFLRIPLDGDVNDVMKAVVGVRVTF